MVKLFFNYLIFPGFLFSACVGLIAGCVDRKLSARIQWRVGPPWQQNFTDILKLLGKEIIVPEGRRIAFLLAPLLGLLSQGAASAILGMSIIFPLGGFDADLIVVVYLLAMPAMALIMGASSSRNPLASLGARRELRLILAYEFAFILSVITVAIKSRGAIQLGQILNHQINFGSNIASFSGALAFLVILVCAQAKLGFVPFDASEAEQEIMSGVLIEYSGLPLALFKLAKAILLYTLPIFLIILFLGKDTSPLFMILKFSAILTAFILIKNTNPRLRIDQAVRFFWGAPALLAVIAVILALFGK